MSRTINAACPRDTEDGSDDCEGTVTVELEYEPADPHYGADADGNRGMYVAGYWCGTAADTCTLGHALTDAEQCACEVEAQYEAGSEDEYTGPDGPEDYD